MRNGVVVLIAHVRCQIGNRRATHRANRATAIAPALLVRPISPEVLFGTKLLAMSAATTPAAATSTTTTVAAMPASAAMTTAMAPTSAVPASAP